MAPIVSSRPSSQSSEPAPQLPRRYFAVLTSPSPRSVTDLLRKLATDATIVSHPEWPMLLAVLEDYRDNGDDDEAVRDLVAWHSIAARHSFTIPVNDTARNVV